MKVQFGTYIKPAIMKEDGVDKIKKYLKNVKSVLDESIYGHDVSKDQLIKIIIF